MTWDEFKKRVEAAGVRGQDVIDYIDISRFCGTLEVSILDPVEGKPHCPDNTGPQPRDFRVTD